MSDEAKLAYTVHHKGRRYPAGSTAQDVGPAAAEFGDHVWEGGKAPASLPGEGSPEGGDRLGARTVPTPSGLPGGADDVAIATATRTQGGNGYDPDGGGGRTPDEGDGALTGGEGSEGAGADAADGGATPPNANSPEGGGGEKPSLATPPAKKAAPRGGRPGSGS